jgi:hypothetical protein
VLEFERNEQPTFEQSESVRRLEVALAKDPKARSKAVAKAAAARLMRRRFTEVGSYFARWF